jgi:hypothetical protein
MNSTLSKVASLTFVALLPACSTHRGSKPPTAVNLDRYDGSTHRADVLGSLGLPEYSTADRDGATCDHYRLYTLGYGTADSIPVSIAHNVTDAATVGLAGLGLPPAKRAYEHKKRPVIFCYRNSQLARITEIDSAGTLAASNPHQVAVQSNRTESPQSSPAAASPTISSAANSPAGPAMPTSPQPASSSSAANKTPDQLPPSMITQD